jgi:hypothetical protein
MPFETMPRLAFLQEQPTSNGGRRNKQENHSRTNEFKISFVERGLNRRIVHVVWFGVSLRDNGDGME